MTDTYLINLHQGLPAANPQRDALLFRESLYTINRPVATRSFVVIPLVLLKVLSLGNDLMSRKNLYESNDLYVPVDAPGSRREQDVILVSGNNPCIVVYLL